MLTKSLINVQFSLHLISIYYYLRRWMSEFFDQQSNIRLPIRKSAESSLNEQCIDYQDKQPSPDLQLKLKDFVNQQSSEKKLESRKLANKNLQSLNEFKRYSLVQQQKRQQPKKKIDIQPKQSGKNVTGSRKCSNQSLLNYDFSRIHQTAVDKQKFRIQYSQQCKQQQLKIEHVQNKKETYRSKKIQLKDFSITKMITKFRSNQNQKQCRICLQNQKQGQMIRPCICSGSINHAHQKCIIQWILTKTDAKGRKKVRCQVCNFQYKYKIIKNRQISCQQYKKSYQNNPAAFRCFYFVMTILIIVLLAMITVIILSDTQGQAGQKIRSGLISTDSSRIIFACVVFIYFSILVITAILFVVEYAVKLQINIQDVLDIAQIASNNKNRKIYPKKKQKTQTSQ